MLIQALGQLFHSYFIVSPVGLSKYKFHFYMSWFNIPSQDPGDKRIEASVT